MRLLTAVSIFFAISTTTVTDAAEGPMPRKSNSYERKDTNRRPSTVDYRGLCQRDNGRPFSDLNLNHTCDREEFFARLNERGGNRR